MIRTKLDLNLSAAVFQNKVFFFQYFTGNRDQNTVVQHRFYPPIKARFIQVRPWGWYGHISMRVEFYGCAEGMNRFELFMYWANVLVRS